MNSHDCCQQQDSIKRGGGGDVSIPNTTAMNYLKVTIGSYQGHMGHSNIHNYIVTRPFLSKDRTCKRIKMYRLHVCTCLF